MEFWHDFLLFKGKKIIKKKYEEIIYILPYKKKIKILDNNFSLFIMSNGWLTDVAKSCVFLFLNIKKKFFLMYVCLPNKSYAGVYGNLIKKIYFFLFLQTCFLIFKMEKFTISYRISFKFFFFFSFFLFICWLLK